MKAKYIGETEVGSLIKNKEYECLGEENGLLRIIDEEGIDDDADIQGYLYEKHLFSIKENDDGNR